MPSLAGRFWAKVDKTGDCWTWTAARNVHGYGKLGVGNGRHEGAHRVSWRLHYGDPGKLNVLHRCDNPPCVRPDHLFLGTMADNMADKIRKGRANQPRGERIGKAVLTADRAREARAMVAAGRDRKEVAAMYGIGKTTLQKIVTRKTWRHV